MIPRRGLRTYCSGRKIPPTRTATARRGEDPPDRSIIPAATLQGTCSHPTQIQYWSCDAGKVERDDMWRRGWGCQMVSTFKNPFCAGLLLVHVQSKYNFIILYIMAICSVRFVFYCGEGEFQYTHNLPSSLVSARGQTTQDAGYNNLLVRALEPIIKEHEASCLGMSNVHTPYCIVE